MSRRQMVAGAAVSLGALWAVDAPALTRSALKLAKTTATAPKASVPVTVAAVRDADSLWEDSIGREFYLDGPAGTVMMTLLAMTALPCTGIRPATVTRKRAFELRFDTGRVSAPRTEKIYTVYGRETGRAQLFLSPSNLSPNVMTAVFN